MATQEQKKYDVGILGWWYGKNYGSILTYFGLNRAIAKLGYNVVMVHEALGYNKWRGTWSDDIVSMEFAKRVGYNYTKQEHYTKLPALNSDISTFIVGSDQLWNPLIGRVNDDLFLDFVSPENRRIAYATSFGNKGVEKFKPDFTTKHTENLKKFNAISVREGYAVETAKQVFDVKATQVLDPVFLLPKSEYETLAEQATITVEGDYVAVFFLDPTPEKKQVAESIADKLGISKIAIIPNPDGGRELAKQIFTGERFQILSKDSPENFLNTYQNAQYVLTDSFHGSAFAVILGKPFSSIYNTHRGADRFKNLLNSLGFGDSRRVYETDSIEKINENPNVALKIDFSKAAKHIDGEREMSLRWLKAALSSKLMPSSVDVSAEKKLSLIERPSFTANNAAWQIDYLENSTKLTVAPGAAVRGNLVWCELPFPLQKKAAYRVTVKWAVRTVSGSINLHLRNGETEKFLVAGSIAVKGQTNTLRTDIVDFIVPDDGFTQLMFGAVHFTGANAGADVSSIAVEKIQPDDVITGSKPATPAEKAKAVALKDNDRFVSAYAQNMVSRSVGNARALLMFHSHGIEKGLSRSDFRPGFGKIAIPNLAKEMNKWVAAGRDTDDQFFAIAASVMRTYFERHKILRADVSAYRELFNAPVQDLIDKADARQGGVLAADIAREADIEADQDRNFLDVVFGRRSVREFTAAPVTDDEIRRAVEIAMQAPSVCNRQPARVHQFDDADTIKAVLELQGGFAGYKMPPKLFLVTSDLKAFLFAVERNQAFIDGGLFMMTLLLGLEKVGLGACCLNTAMSTERENAARKLLNIPESEIFISFIAVGHFDPAVLTPRSKRIPLKEVLVPTTVPTYLRG